MASPAFEEIAETFEFLDDWEERYRHVIELGKAMDPLEDAVKVPATKVDGCASQVWILPQIAGEGAGATFHFRGDSDAMIVRGLIAVLHALYDGLSVGEVLKVDAGGRTGAAGAERSPLLATLERSARNGRAHPPARRRGARAA